LGEVGEEPAAGEAATAREMLEAMVGSALNNSLSALGLGALIDLYA